MSPVIYKDRIARLPTWAQDHIANLERRIAELQIEVTQATTGADCDPRNAWVQVPDANGRSLDPWVPSRHRTIRFMFGESDTRDFIEFRMEQERIAIYGASTLAINPSSSNFAYVSLDKKGWT